MHILLIEDHQRLAALIRKGLERMQFTVDSCTEGAEGLAALRSSRFDAVILDLGLPDMDGMQVLREMREADNAVPVLVLTSRIRVSDRVQGLDAGADDYLTKPFDMGELVARLRALLRRPSSLVGKILNIGNLTFDTGAREASIAGQALMLTPLETRLLELLVRRGGKVVPKTQLEDNLYGMGETISSNSLEVLVHRLRKKLSDAGAQVSVHTVRGVGYMLTGEDG